MERKNYRKYGEAPYKFLLIHGGPGAIGDLKPLAEELSKKHSLIETLHRARSVNGQLAEIDEAISEECKTPVTLVGHSWGAWLAYIYASRHPSSVKKLIMLSSGTFDPELKDQIASTRHDRLKPIEFERFRLLQKQLKKGSLQERNEAFSAMGNILVKLDSYSILSDYKLETFCDHEVFRNVYSEADALRNSGTLLNFGKKIECPVVAIHGKYDPHPPEGTIRPLNRVLDNFNYITIEKCGHYPWLENFSRDKFFSILNKELS